MATISELELATRFNYNAKDILYDQKQRIVNLVIHYDDPFSVEEKWQSCKIYLTPCNSGRWYAWGDAHIPADDPEASDAIYDFLNGGEFFYTRSEALQAIYSWVQTSGEFELNVWKGMKSEETLHEV